MKVTYKIEISTTGNGRWHWLTFPEVGNYGVSIQIGYGDTLKFLKEEVEWAKKFNVYYENLNEVEEYCKKYLKICKYKEENFEDELFVSNIKTYIMKDTNTNLYKIGRSVSPKHRERTLQSEKPTIKMIKVFNRDIEKELHNKYKDFRVRGEWFNLNKVQINYICTKY